jgi:hypothetical protein
MVILELDGERFEIKSDTDLAAALKRCSSRSEFELWISAADGPSMCMLRNGDDAFLMYLRHDEDPGFTTRGPNADGRMVGFRLSNGQMDEYPVRWCIPLEDCFKALAHFFAANGAQPPWLEWHED